MRFTLDSLRKVIRREITMVPIMANREIIFPHIFNADLCAFYEIYEPRERYQTPSYVRK